MFLDSFLAYLSTCRDERALVVHALNGTLEDERLHFFRFSLLYIVVSSLLLSPSIYKSFCNTSSAPPPRLVYKLFAGGKVM